MFLNKMTWQDIEKIDFDKSIVFLPIAPLEEHSYHLPIGTDCFLAEKACEMSANKLKEISDYEPFIFPMIPLGIAKPTSDFAGTISMPDDLYTRLVENILLHISNWGFKYCVIVTTHLDFSHIISIHAAIRLVQRKREIKVIEPAADWLFGKRKEDDENNISEIDKEYPDMHAGRWETSLMLHLYPDMVKTSLIENLPHRKINNIDWSKTWRQQGAVEGHMGTPSLATSEIGKSEVRHLEGCAKAAIDLMNGNTCSLPELVDEKVNTLIQSIEAESSDCMSAGEQAKA